MIHCKAPRTSIQFPPLSQRQLAVIPTVSQMSLILKARNEHHNNNMLRWDHAARKRDAEEFHFVKHQKKYYESIEKENARKKPTFKESIEISREREKEKQTTIKLVEHTKNQQLRRTEHYKQAEVKREAAALRKVYRLDKTRKLLHRQNSNSSSSLTIRTQKSYDQQCFALSVHRQITEKQDQASRNFSELSERKKQNSYHKIAKMSEVYQRKNENYQNYKKKSLNKIVDVMSKSQIQLQKMELLEKGLIQNRSKRNTQSLHKVRQTKAYNLRQKQEKVLRQERIQNSKIQQAQARRQNMRKCNSQLTSKHYADVLNKSKKIKQKENLYIEQKTLRKMERYKEIDSFKMESERMRQRIIASKYIKKG